MPEPELTVRDLTPPIPVSVCDSGRHPAHPGETCEDVDELQAVFAAYLEQAFREAYAWAEAEAERMFDHLYVTGQGTGEPRGFLAMTEEREPSPVERALAILGPHLRDCPLYDARPEPYTDDRWEG